MRGVRGGVVGEGTLPRGPARARAAAVPGGGGGGVGEALEGPAGTPEQKGAHVEQAAAARVAARRLLRHRQGRRRVGRRQRHGEERMQRPLRLHGPLVGFRVKEGRHVRRAVLVEQRNKRSEGPPVDGEHAVLRGAAVRSRAGHDLQVHVPVQRAVGAPHRHRRVALAVVVLHHADRLGGRRGRIMLLLPLLLMLIRPRGCIGQRGDSGAARRDRHGPQAALAARVQ